MAPGATGMLNIEAVRHRYPGAGRWALDGIDLKAAGGEILGLLGPNGAGKTTLMGLVAGLLPGPTEGRIDLDGQDIAQARRTEPRAIALAPQADAFYPSLSARENLACFVAALGLAGKAADTRVEQALADVGLGPQATQRASQLSGGQRRRLNLALALLGRPRLLLLDEPTAGVDPASRQLLHARLRAAADQGSVVVFSSHLMGEVEDLASRIVILDQGRVLRQGTLNELLADDSQRLLLELAPGPSAEAVGALLGRHGVVRREGETWELRLPDGRGAVATLAALEAEGLALRGARWGRASLEHTFVALTQQAEETGAHDGQ